MKATKLVLAAAFVAGLATLAFAGPSALFTNQQASNRKQDVQAQAQPAVPAKVQPAVQAAACANCNCACGSMKKT